LNTISYFVNDEQTLRSLFCNTDVFFHNEQTVIHTDRNTTKKIFRNNRLFAVKSFQLANLAQRIGYVLFRKPKAERSLLNSLMLIKAGLHSPKPIGYIYKKKNFQVLESYYISEFHEFEHDLLPIFEKFDQNADLLRAFIKTIIVMHDNNIYHHDLTKRNVLINSQTNHLFSFVDNNRITIEHMSLKKRMESISKLTNKESELIYLAKCYSKHSTMPEKDCIKFILKGFNKSQRYKRIKRMFKNKKGAFDLAPFFTRGN
jgi:tRNA A-37 threonylcarbamoyl transferase component Bud32